MRFFWLALFAVLLNALAPAVSQALAASRPDIPVDFCAMDGGMALATAAALLNDDHHGGAMPDHGCCLQHAAGHALPPPFLVPRVAVLGGEPRPFLFHHAPRPLLAWTAAVPRGPPVFA